MDSSIPCTGKDNMCSAEFACTATVTCSCWKGGKLPLTRQWRNVISGLILVLFVHRALISGKMLS